MSEKETRPVGQTKDTGWQIGARRTFPIPLEDAWRLVTSPDGLRLWLGDAPTLDFTTGAAFSLPDGASGEMRVFKPNSHLRLTHHPPGWPRPSTIQLRVIPNKDKTVIAFHQEHLPGPEEREQRRLHFLAALDKLEQMIPTS
jgi:uncharacterized protein YndB with AHSA1/START domain